jgi:hypothetical protein
MEGRSQKKFLDVIDAWVGGWKSKIFARTSFDQEEKRERRIAQHKRKKEVRQPWSDKSNF